jgi:pSer/pThr/pTyr-binding forkhead associated (FHA) protein
MIGILEVIAGPDRGKRYYVGKRPLAVGRSPASGIVLGDPTVSRTHCEISWEGDQVRVTDKGSHGGTWVNGERLNGTRPLQAGDLLALGETRLEFKWSHEDEKATTSWEMP